MISMDQTNNGKMQSHRRRKPDRAGVIFALFVVMLVVFVGAVALSVDVGYMVLVRSQLRTSTDAAARAAGEALGRTQDVEAAYEAARNLAAANLVANDPLLLADEDIIAGNSSQAPAGGWVFTPGGFPTNSIRVMGRRTEDAPSGAVNLFFGRIFNQVNFQPTKVTTVVRSDRDICLVVDRSSSMKLDVDDLSEGLYLDDPRVYEPPNSLTSRWAALDECVTYFNALLVDTPQIEYVGLVSYASDFSIADIDNVASSIDQELNANVSLVNQKINNLSNTAFNGNTEISKGIEDGIKVLTNPNTARPFANKTMILFTDGNYTNETAPSTTALLAKSQHVIIHTITFGDAANQLEMKAVADATGGKHYHAPDTVALKNIFREIAFSLDVFFSQ